LRVVAVGKHSVPLVEFRLLIPFAVNDAATAELLAETILTGTPGFDRVAIDNALAEFGGDLGTRVDPAHLIISGHCLSEGLPRVLDIAASLLTSANYDDTVVAGERDRLLDHIEMARSQPETIAREAMLTHLYDDHPAAKEMPQVDEMKKVTVAEVKALHAKAVVPRGSTLLIVGDVQPMVALEIATGALADWLSDNEAQELAPLPVIAPGKFSLIHRDKAVQSQLRLAAPAITRQDPRFTALSLANIVYAGFFSSRLVENIREDKGYTYHASSAFDHARASTALFVKTDVATVATAGALWEVQYELGRIVVHPPTDEELATARQYLAGSVLLGTASLAGLTGTLLGLIAVGLGLDWLNAQPAAIAAVTAEEVHAAAKEFFAPNRFTGIVVGDATQVGDSLRALGLIDEA
jgi:predicted Zn-dependent peptidase